VQVSVALLSVSVRDRVYTGFLLNLESQAIAGLITRQRQEQEALLRTFTSG